jgi:hypothetical protein
MKVIIRNEGNEDFMKLIPESKEDRKELSKLRPPFNEIISGGYPDGSIGIVFK